MIELFIFGEREIQLALSYIYIYTFLFPKEKTKLISGSFYFTDRGKEKDGDLSFSRPAASSDNSLVEIFADGQDNCSWGFYEAAPMAFTGTLRGRLVTVVAPCLLARHFHTMLPRHFHTRAPGFHTRCLFLATLRSGSDTRPKSFHGPLRSRNGNTRILIRILFLTQISMKALTSK